MPGRLVVGIISDCEPSHVEKALAAAGIDRANLKVLTAEEASPRYTESPISFVHVAEALAKDSFSDDLTRGTGVIPDFGGTNVPGLNDEDTSLGVFSHPDLIDYIGDSDLPGGDAEEYSDAIADGRCVIVYTCDPSQVDTVQSALKSAGITEVKAY